MNSPVDLREATAPVTDTAARPLATELAQWAARLSFDDVPTDVVDAVCDHVLDTLGVSLAALTMDYPVTLLASLQAGAAVVRPEEQTSLLGQGIGLTAQDAALFNGSLSHGVDIDDTHLEALLHPTGAVLPVVLAVGERHRVDGARLLTGLAAGIEVICRLGLAAGVGLVNRGFHPTGILGPFAGVIAGGVVAGDDADTIRRALGIVGGMAGGLHQTTIDGSWNKQIHSGLAARGAVVALSLARQGVTSPEQIFEGPKGVFETLTDLDIDAGPVFEGLGTHWEAGRLAFKIYPCCQGAHPYVDAALEVRSLGIEADEIEAVRVFVGTKVGTTLCEPKELKIAPPQPYAGRFSIPWTVAAALATGRIDRDTYTDANLIDPDICALARKVTYEVDERYDAGMSLAGAIRVSCRDGRVEEIHIDAARGTPQNPLTRVEVEEKFCEISGPVLTAEQHAALIELIRALPRTEDAALAIARACVLDLGKDHDDRL